MKFKVEFSMDSAAFDIEPRDETTRILKEVSAKVERDGFTDDGSPVNIRDVNGNTIGSYQITTE